MTSFELNFDDFRQYPVTTDGRSIKIGSLSFSVLDHIDFGGSIGTIPADHLMARVIRYNKLTGKTCTPQLAVHIFVITRQPRLLNHYFPLMFSADQDAATDFYALILRILEKSSFDLQLFGENRTNLTSYIGTDISYLVAGHIAEIFFRRRDLLDQFLSQKRGFFLYATPQAFKDDGGVAGGCYHPQRDAIQLVLSRLYEGFYAPTPGVAPFIHEFGHMLDHASGGRGLLPSMTEFLDEFRAGKSLELERYGRIRQAQTDSLPIGHPYVFQNDGEFIAGYLEMFFRNPHYFAAQNPALYGAFSNCLKHDPRQYWQQDFSYYVNQNRDYYLSGQRPPKAGITLSY